MPVNSHSDPASAGTQEITAETLSYEQVAQMIDHSLLRPELTPAEVLAGCELAERYRVASVCVKPCDVELAAKALRGSSVKVGTVVGFPHGSSATATKVFEAKLAMEQGAVELDMVINIGRLRGGEAEYVLGDIQAVVEVAKRGGALVKVILENAYLSEEQKVLGCQLSEQAGADFVKTSTGFAPSGATLEDLKLMREAVSPHVQIKAAGGVRTLDALLEVMRVGTTRVGATATAAILEEFKARKAGGVRATGEGGLKSGY
ncbi:deoxyribose-phosphate aldolase [Allomeiothermus silvanus DSM 9946]|uniref:Deoxyribose-phosphate aldolase n=1 Tax=Allomeiothermus silvanus (strain ATCC 700542 / DSM 9946 / NBRC 106475 / NCIMB 13440 / VI-R2) TaxID=526227 RepID=D7BDI0_ALLS1|nr:deoxyribose-phosphate aldolase [Allomeiothermus silvanus]ADH64800.1 deoxyribose-phosphate aldolase [Allomeiothermus silvanus DSM 9946]